MKVVLADYGAGNLRSLSSALVRAGADPVVTTDPELVSEAPLAMIAGVGHVGSAAAGLRRNGLDEALRERVAAGRPVAGVCVGRRIEMRMPSGNARTTIPCASRRSTSTGAAARGSRRESASSTIF